MFTHSALSTVAEQAYDVPIATIDRIDDGRNRAVHVTHADGHEAIIKTATRFPEAFDAEVATMELVRAATEIPVPAVYDTGADPLGVPFAVIEYVPGAGCDWLRELRPPAAVGVCRTAGRHLAAVHEIRFEQCGRLAVTDGELAVAAGRSLREQLRGSLDRQLALLEETPFATDRDIIATTGERLLDEASLADVSPTLVHGDYRVENLRVRTDSSDDPVAGVLDWERPTAADPRWDALMSLSVLTTGYGLGEATKQRCREAFWAGYGQRPPVDARWRLYELLGRVRLARHVDAEVARLGTAARQERTREHRTVFERLHGGGSVLASGG